MIGTSAWLVIPYSDSCGINFPILLLYLYTRFKDTNKFVIKIVYIVLISMIAYLGFKIKPMAFFIFIAICICEMKCVMKKMHREGFRGCKKALLYITIALISFLISKAAVTGAVNGMGFSIDQEAALG